MRTSFLFVVFSALAVSNVLANPLYADFDFQEREFADNTLETRGSRHGGPSATIQIHLRDLLEDLDARFDLGEDIIEERDLAEDDFLESREPHRGPSATINIHLRNGLDVEERDYFENTEELDARTAVDGYGDELEERGFDDMEDEFEARDSEDALELEAREPRHYFRIGTVILPPSHAAVLPPPGSSNDD